jgi:hypothetical protein
MANQEFFTDLLAKTEGFQSGPPSTSSETSTAPADYSQIDQLLSLLETADAEYTASVQEIRSQLITFVSDLKTYYNANTAVFSYPTGSTELQYVVYNTNPETSTEPSPIYTMDATALTAKWDEFTQARTTLASNIDSAISTKITEYTNLYNEYVRFDGAVGTGVQDVSPIDATTYAKPSRGTSPTVSSDNTLVATYFTPTTGTYDKLRKFVIDEVSGYVVKYKDRFGRLSTDIQKEYPDLKTQLDGISTPIPDTTTTAKIIEIMQIFSGVVSTGPSSSTNAGVSGAIELADKQVVAMESLIAYQTLYIETGTVVSMNAIPASVLTATGLDSTRVSSLITLSTSPSYDTILKSTDGATIDGYKSSFDAGIQDLFKISIAATNAIVDSYAMQRYRYLTLITNGYGVAELSSNIVYALNSDKLNVLHAAYSTNNTRIRAIRDKYLSGENALVKLLVDFATPKISSTPYTNLSAASSTVIDGTNTSAMVKSNQTNTAAIRVKLNDLDTALYQYATTNVNTLITRFNQLYDAAVSAGYMIPESIPQKDTTKTSFTPAVESYKIYSSEFVNLYNALRSDLNKNIASYNDLLLKYGQFSTNVMSQSTRNVDDYLAPTPANLIASAPAAAVPAESALTSLTVSDISNFVSSSNSLKDKLILFGIDGKVGSTSTSGDLLPRLIKLVRDEVKDYVQKYEAVRGSKAPSTRTLGTYESKLTALDGTTIPSATLITIMSEYTTFTSQLFTSIDVDAIWDAIDEYNTLYADNLVILSSTTTSKKDMISPDAIQPDIDAITKMTSISQGVFNDYIIKYTDARSALYKGAISDLTNIQSIYNSVFDDYLKFKSTFSTQFGDFTDLTVVKETTNLTTDDIKNNFSSENATTLNNVRNDLLEQRIPKILSEINSRLNTFYKDLTDKKTKSELTSFKSLPVAPPSSSESYTITNGSNSYISDGKRLVVSMSGFIENMKSYTTFLNNLITNIRNEVKEYVDSFTALYTTENTTILGLPSATPPPQNIQTETARSNASTALNTIKTASYSELIAIRDEYVALKESLLAILRVLGGKQLKRTEVTGWSQEYYTYLYDLFDNLPADYAFKPSATTTSALEILKDNFGDAIIFLSPTTTFTNKETDDLQETFAPFAAGSNKDGIVVPRGSYYDALIIDFRTGVIAMIAKLKNEYETNLTQITARGIPDKFKNIAEYTRTDETSLSTETDKDKIELLRIKYSGLLSDLDTVIRAGNQSIEKRNDAKNAMKLYKSVETIFKASLFSIAPGAAAYSSNQLYPENKILLERVDSYLGESGDTSTTAFNSLSDEQLLEQTTIYKLAIPVNATGAIDYSVGSSDSETIVASKTIVANVKAALLNRIATFKRSYDSYSALWSLPNVSIATDAPSPTVLPIQLKDMNSKITELNASVENAASQQGLIDIIARLTSAADGGKGYEILLTEYVGIVGTLKTQRVSTQNVMLAYSSLYATFTKILTTTDANYDEFILYLDSDNKVDGCSGKFYALMTGEEPTTPVASLDAFKINRSLKTLSSYFGGAGLAALYLRIGENLKVRMDELQTAYGSKDIFNQVMATKGRLSAPSTSVFASAPSIANKLIEDKARVDTAVAAKNGPTLLAIMNEYLGTTADGGLLKYIDTVASDLSAGKEEREQTESAMQTYYNMYLPFSEKDQLLGPTYGNPLLTTLFNYLRYDGASESYFLQDAFYNQSNDALNEIEEDFKYGSKIENGPDLTSTETSDEPIIQTIRRRLYDRISSFKKDLTSLRSLFEQEGVQVSDDLNPSKALGTNGYIEADISAIPSMSIDILEEKQSQYATTIAKFNEKAGPLLETRNLREKIAQNVRAYYDIFLEFKDNLLNNGSGTPQLTTDVNNDIAKVISYFAVSQNYTPTGTFNAIVDNTILTEIRDTYASDGAAYQRLISAIRIATVSRIQGFIQKYKDNQSEIEVEGKAIPERLQGVLEPIPPETLSFPNKLIQDISSKTLANLRIIRTDYYGGEGKEGLFSLIDSTAAGGLGLKTARQDLNQVAENYEDTYNLFVSKLFSTVQPSNIVKTGLARIRGPYQSNQYLYTFNNGVKSLTPWYKSLDETAINTIKNTFDTSYFPTLKTDVVSELKNVIAAFKKKYEDNEELFDFVVSETEFEIPNNVAIRYNSYEVDYSAAVLSASFTQLEQLQDKYIGSSGASFELNTTISEATLAKARYDTRVVIISYYTLYAMFVSEVLSANFTTPALELAKTYIGFTIDGWPYQTAFNNLTISQLQSVNTTFTQQISSLYSTIKTALTEIVSSFANLRKSYTDFYAVHGANYSLEDLPPAFKNADVNADTQNISTSTVAAIDALQTIRKKYVPPSYSTEKDPILSMDSYLLPSLVEFVKRQMSKVIYDYNKTYTDSPNKNILGSYTSYSSDMAIVSSPTASASALKTLTGDYGSRLVALDNVSIQFAAYNAMHDYIITYISVAAILPSNYDMTLINLFYKYITDEKEYPTYPFKTDFITEIKTEPDYKLLRDKYVQGKLDIQSILSTRVSSVVDQFFTAYGMYSKIIASGRNIPISIDDRVHSFYATYKAAKSDGVKYLIEDEKFITFNLLNKFISDMELVMQDSKYRQCIERDVSGQTQPAFSLNYIRNLF